MSWCVTCPVGCSCPASAATERLSTAEKERDEWHASWTKLAAEDVRNRAERDALRAQLEAAHKEYAELEAAIRCGTGTNAESLIEQYRKDTGGGE